MVAIFHDLGVHVGREGRHEPVEDGARTELIVVTYIGISFILFVTSSSKAPKIANMSTAVSS